MRGLHTIACVAAGLVLGCAEVNANAQDNDDFDHADRFTNRDLLEQPERDQRLWLSGVVVGMAVGVASIDVDAGECITDWYFNDETQVFVNARSNFERFPEHAPAIVVLALARRACPALDQYRK